MFFKLKFTQIMILFYISHFSLFHTYFLGKEHSYNYTIAFIMCHNLYKPIKNIMCIENTQNKTSNRPNSNFQGFRGCIIQVIKTKKTIKNKKTKNLNLFLKNPGFPPLIVTRFC